MDFTTLSLGIQNYILSIIILSTCIGSIVNFIKSIVCIFKPNLKTKVYKLFLIILPHIITILLYLLLKLVKQNTDILQFILASSLSSFLYRVLVKMIELYVLKMKERKSNV